MRKEIILAASIAILAVGCGSSTSKKTAGTTVNSETKTDSTNFLKPRDMNITDEKWKEILDRVKVLRKQEEEEWFETFVFEDIDQELGAFVLSKLFEKKGWQPVTDSQYVERVKYIYGIDLDGHKYPKDNKLQKRKDYTVYFVGDPELQYYDIFPNRDDVYFYRKLGILRPGMPTPLSYVHSNESGDYFIDRERFDLFDYHWNNYLLKGNKASLVKIVNDPTNVYYFYDLVYYFGFDKEEIVNKKTLNHLLLHAENYNSDYNHLFAAHDIYGELDIRDGLLSTVANLSSKDSTRYYTMLENYIRCCVEAPLVSGNDIQDVLFKEFNADERREIIARCIPTLQSLYSKYYSGGKNTVSPVITEALHTDPDMLPEWQKNNYYGIEGLSEIVESVNNDE